MGQVELAVSTQRLVLEGVCKEWGGDHPQAITARLDLAHMLLSARQSDEALALSEEAARLSDRVNGKGHAFSITAWGNTGNVLRSLGRHDEAEEILRGLLDGARQRGVRFGRNLLSIQHNLALVLADRGQSEASLELHRRTVQEAEAALEPENPYLARFRTIYAQRLLEAGPRSSDGRTLREAEAQLRLAVDVLRRAFGESGDWTRQARELLDEATRRPGRDKGDAPPSAEEREADQSRG
jgi:tetratricopeptide (TPR) repeat protein